MGILRESIHMTKFTYIGLGKVETVKACIHLGESTGERADCSTCPARVHLPIMACGVHGKCTVAKAVDDVQCCATCRSFDDGSTKPWHYPVSICIPHLDTPEQLGLAVSLWRKQTIRPYLLIVDTGSEPSNLARVQAMRGPDLEVHCLQRHPERHPSCNVSVALDLAHSLCRTDVLFHTHTDVFPRKRDFLHWMVSQCSAADPVVGWRMSPRGNGPWEQCVSHTATAIHIPTARRHGLQWSLDGYLGEYPEEVLMWSGWPDTESGLWLTLKRAGIVPTFLGDDLNHERLVTEWFDHSRSYTGLKRGAKGSDYWKRAEADMIAAETEARKRLEQWR